MTDYNGYEDNFDYLPDAINPFPEDKEVEPMNDKHLSGKENHPGFWQDDEDDDKKDKDHYSKEPVDYYYSIIDPSKEEHTDTWPEGEDPDDWEKKFRESMKRRSNITEDEADQLNRGQMGIMDEDSHQGDIGSPVMAASRPQGPPLICHGCLTTGGNEKFGVPTKCPHCGSEEVHLDRDAYDQHLRNLDMQDIVGQNPFAFDDDDWEQKIKESNKPSNKSYIRCAGCRRREEPSNPKFASWWNDGTGFPPYYCPTCVDKGEVPTQQKQASSDQTWYPFYATVGDDDNPGYETDPEHGVAGRDTDDKEEDADADYGGKNKRRNNLSDSNLSTLVAMGGIGAIPEGFHGKDDVHYGDDKTFSHEQSNSPSQTGISGENSKDFDSFDTEWNK